MPTLTMQLAQSADSIMTTLLSPEILLPVLSILSVLAGYVSNRSKISAQRVEIEAQQTQIDAKRVVSQDELRVSLQAQITELSKLVRDRDLTIAELKAAELEHVRKSAYTDAKTERQAQEIQRLTRLVDEYKQQVDRALESNASLQHEKTMLIEENKRLRKQISELNAQLSVFNPTYNKENQE